jgi:hypothetical protein
MEEIKGLLCVEKAIEWAVDGRLRQMLCRSTTSSICCWSFSTSIIALATLALRESTSGEV